ncbi:MAG: DnaA regulatory inactivator Hda [Gammaproteobacteria bacterium]|nr:DnaA regulatory inactivator Hda [Gammaproteobacteria bacterium]
MNSVQQLSLGLALKDNDSFESFHGEANAELVAGLIAAARGEAGANLHIWGEAGSGRSHLLHAVCQAADAAGLAVAYLPVAELLELSPEVLEGIEQFTLVCLDDIGACAGRRDWEEALFHAYNRVQAAGGRWLSTADNVPQSLGLGLKDLVSRLGWGMIYQLKPLDEAGKLAALQKRARLRGFELSDEVGQFLLRRLPRDNAALFSMLDRLDRESYAAQRRLTVPFVKQVLDL